MKDLKEIWTEVPLSWKIAFFICLGATLGLLTAGFITPPPGEVDDSILKACFMISVYPTLFTAFICVLRGMKIHYDIKDGEITINSAKQKVSEEADVSEVTED